MATKKLISLSLTKDEIALLDALVTIAENRAINPKQVNRSTVICDLMVTSMREIQLNKTSQGGNNE
jgi:hypothetical protein